MLLKNKIHTDVLVVGAGLAGIMAAVSAAESGVRVALASSSGICSGSSFYPGTWGLGLVAPYNSEDEKDLLNTILITGEQMADRKLSEYLVSHIREGICYLNSMGVRLKEAENRNEKEFIPCFDHKVRSWHGFVKEDAGSVFRKRIKELGIVELPDTEVIECVMKDGRAAGAIAVEQGEGLVYLSCNSLVVASGGLGKLFRYHLNTEDVTGLGHYIALKAGAKLINLEFMQMMPGYLNPAYKTIYNEKVFKFSRFCYPQRDESVFRDWQSDKLKKYLEIRSTHGPFTSRLESRDIDIKLYEEFRKDKRGVTVSYDQKLLEDQPEFICTYFDWLKKEKHLTVGDKIQLGIFAHASNGGIKIDETGWTGVPGLFACGEAAGGMHGADRIGGLSTANALVFGRIAGSKAAEYGSGHYLTVPEVDFTPDFIPNAAAYIRQIQDINHNYAMVIRDRDGALTGLSKLNLIGQELNGLRRGYGTGAASEQEIKASYELKAALVLTKCLLHAILLRKESRGPHYRPDYPVTDKNLARCITSVYNKEVNTGFQT